jgi:pimeloyl-ACP methyl ester carboxylesterase
MILLHGALGSHHQLAALQAEFGATANILEFFGHGRTDDLNGTWTVDVFADQLEAALEQNDRPVPIFGYSMGGYIAMMVALRRPELISRILTLGTKLAWNPETVAEECRKLDPTMIEAKVPAFAADLERRHGPRWRQILASTAELMTDLGAAPRLTPEGISSLTVPLRLALGDRDEMVSFDETMSFFQALRQSASKPTVELAVIPGTRHPIEKVDHATLAFHIRQWLLP